MGEGSLGTAMRFRDFRFIWLADVASIAGDQLARVALAVLVYGRTQSALAATVTYALTFLPALLGGVLLSWVADRFRRREVMVVTDLLRAVLVAAMAVPGLSLWVVCGLLVVVVLLGSPFTAARSALLPDVLPGDHYERGLALVQISSQTAQLAGFAGGGLLVAAVSPSVALLGNAGTFLLSAALVRFGVGDRAAPGATADRRVGGTAAVLGAIVTDRRRRALVLLAWLVGWYVVPEALAAPYADQIGAGTAAVGLLMAADPLGSVLGAWLFTRFVPAPVRGRLVGVLAAGAGLPLVACLFQPGLPVTLVLWGLSGMLATAYLLQTQAEFVRATLKAERGRAIGVAASGIIAAQGLAVLAGGLVADLTDPATAVAVAGSVGTLLCAAVAVSWHRATAPGSPTAVTHDGPPSGSDS